jgi:Flp pilus assembly protein TadD
MINASTSSRNTTFYQLLKISYDWLECEMPDLRSSKSKRSDFDRAYACHMDGQYAEAIELYQSHLKRRVDNAAPLNNLALCYMEIGKPDDALQLHARASLLKPSSALYCRNYGIALAKTENYKQACVELQRAIDLSPPDAELHCCLAACFAMRDRCSTAYRHIIRSIQLNPFYRRSWELLALNSGLAIMYALSTLEPRRDI